MSNRANPIAMPIVIVLLVVNIALTAYVALRSQPGSLAELRDAAATADISASDAEAMADKLVPLYNAGDTAALYAQFDPLAKVQLTEAKLGEQLGELKRLIGTIDGHAFGQAEVAGQEGGRTYYRLSYKVRLSGGPFEQGDLQLTVTRDERGLSLFGFFLFGRQQRT